MRFEVLVGAVAVSGMVLGIACSSSEVGGPFNPAPDAAPGTTSGDPAPPFDAGVEDADGGQSNGKIPITTSLLVNGVAAVIDVTADGQVIYLTGGGAAPRLEAIPIGGGTPTVIEAAYDSDIGPVISGGAVGYWTGVVGEDGTLNVWTKASGSRRALSTTSPIGFFAANEDGSRVAFLTSAATNVANLAIVDTTIATPTVTPLLAPADQVNLVAFECPPMFGFAGTNLLATFCAGENPLSKDARAYWVAGGTSLVRLDDVGTGTGTGPITPGFFLADRTGSKVYVVSNTPARTGRIVGTAATVGGVTSTVVEDGVELAGFMTDDGQSLVYRTTTGGIKRTSTTAPAPKTLAAAATGFLGVSRDLSRMLYRTVSPSSPLLDIRSADTVTESQTGIAIVATPSSAPYGFTGNGGHVVYLVSNGTAVQLTSQPTLGGTPLPLALSPVGVLVTPTGSGIALRVSPTYEDQGLRFSALRYLDGATGDTSPILDTAVPEGGIFVFKDKVIFTRLAPQGAGLYTFPIPAK